MPSACHIVCLTAGKHFVAVFGAQQSMLEALLLKRRIMGPSWICLSCPTRVEGGVQVLSFFQPSIFTLRFHGQQDMVPIISKSCRMKLSALHVEAASLHRDGHMCAWHMEVFHGRMALPSMCAAMYHTQEILPALHNTEGNSMLLQVSWCKLEVKVESPKSISTPSPGQQQDTPPLVVAALNLKTTLHPQANFLH